MKLLNTILFLLSPTLLFSQEITLPKEIKAKTGQFVEVPCETDGEEVCWWSPDEGIAVFPTHRLKDSKTCVVSQSRSGGVGGLGSGPGLGGLPTTIIVSARLEGLLSFAVQATRRYLPSF